MVSSEQTQRWRLFPHGLQRYHPLPAAEAHREVPQDPAQVHGLCQHHHLRDGRQHPPGGGLCEPPADLQRVPAPPVRAGEPHHQEPQARDPDRFLRAALLLRRVFGALHVVHPVFPDPVHLLLRVLHARGGAGPDAPGCRAARGAQQPLLLVPGDGGADLHPLHLHLLRHDGAGAAPAAQGAGAGQQRALPALLLHHHPPPHRPLGGLALERQNPPQEIPRGDLHPRALGLLHAAHEHPARRQGRLLGVRAFGEGKGKNQKKTKKKRRYLVFLM